LSVGDPIDTRRPPPYIALTPPYPGNDVPSRSASGEWDVGGSRRLELRFSSPGGEHAAFCVALRAPFRWHPDATF
jgi:hypothetical protein